MYKKQRASTRLSALLINWDLAGTLWRSLPESFTSLFQKRPPIQRAERWSPRARGEISLSACSFLPSEGSRLRLRLSAARQFSFAPLLPKKKASKRFKKALCRKGNPPLVRFFTSPRRSTPTASGPPLFRLRRNSPFGGAS